MDCSCSTTAASPPVPPLSHTSTPTSISPVQPNVDWWAQKIQEVVQQDNFDGWMEDFGEWVQ